MNEASSQQETASAVATARLRNGCMWMAIIILGLATIAAVTSAYFVHIVGGPISDAEKIAEKIVDGWGQSGTVITIDTCKIVDEGKIFEIATYEKTIQEFHEYSTTWFGSTKTFRISRRYVVKYGVAPGPALQFKCVSKQVAQLLDTPISVLSCTPVEGSLKIQTDEGLWNKLTVDEQRKAFEQMLSKARQAAESDEAAKEVAKHHLCKLLNAQPELKSAEISIELP